MSDRLMEQIFGVEARKLKAQLSGRVLCERHPQYRAIRKPTADCKQCRDAWEGKIGDV